QGILEQGKPDAARQHPEVTARVEDGPHGVLESESFERRDRAVEPPDRRIAAEFGIALIVGFERHGPQGVGNDRLEAAGQVDRGARTPVGVSLHEYGFLQIVSYRNSKAPCPRGGSRLCPWPQGIERARVRAAEMWPMGDAEPSDPPAGRRVDQRVRAT